MLLHIGDDQTVVTSGTGTDAGPMLTLAIGAGRTSVDFFKHNPPTPLEIENAIQVVEDEVTRALALALGHASLYSTDERLHDMARRLGSPEGPTHTLTLEQVEGLFNQLAARSEGRPASQVGIPDDPRFAATLLILREFMHHLQFEGIQVIRQ